MRATLLCYGLVCWGVGDRVVRFEPPVVLRSAAGQPQAHSTNTMGLFHLGGANVLFQEFTVDYYP